MATPILAYHLISDHFDLGIARTTPKQFRAQMRWLQEHRYTAITLKDYVAQQTTGTPASARNVVITFDDAYASLERAAEIMQQFGFSGTCFAISDFVGRSNEWDYQFFGRKYWHAGAATLRELLANGWEVGSHSSRHAYLPGLDDARLRADLAGSKQRLQDILGVPVTSLSYPFGRADVRVCTTAEKAGYACAVGLGPVPPALQHVEKMYLPRLGIYLFDSIRTFAAKMKRFGEMHSAVFQFQRLVSFCAGGTVLFKKMFDSGQ